MNDKITVGHYASHPDTNSEARIIDLDGPLTKALRDSGNKIEHPETTRLRAENEALKRDAERYRWIRNGECAGEIVSLFVGDQLDAEIDAAIEADK